MTKKKGSFKSLVYDIKCETSPCGMFKKLRAIEGCSPFSDPPLINQNDITDPKAKAELFAEYFENNAATLP